MILYFLKSAIISTLLYLIYKVLLSKATSFKFIRFFLLAILLISSALPLINLGYTIPIEESTLFKEGNRIISEISIVSSKLQETESIHKQANPYYSATLIAYLCVSLLLLLRMFVSSKILFTKENLKGEKLNGMQLYFVNKNNSIYSFFNRLYLPIKYKDEQLDNCILTHETAHYQQLHSIDNLIVEFYSIVFWFNPFTWLIKKSIKNNHEYLADAETIRTTDETSYLQTILNHVKLINQPILSSSFSYLSIKNRIKMLQRKKTRTHQISSISISIIFSLCLITLFAFKAEKVNQTIDKQVSIQTGFDLYKKPSGIPVPFDAVEKISSEFGKRVNPITKQVQLHKGDDIIADEGTPILATDKGKVIKAEFSEGYGNHIIIQHNIKYKTLYAHLSSLDVKVGDVVKKRQTIGIIGNTGMSIKTHLHYEIHEFDKPIDPDVQTGC